MNMSIITGQVLSFNCTEVHHKFEEAECKKKSYNYKYLPLLWPICEKTPTKVPSLELNVC